MNRIKRFLLKIVASFFCSLSFFSVPAITFGAIFCVDNATDLQNSLTTACSNGENDTIQIVQGSYSGNFVYASTEAYGLTIKGGYSSNCEYRDVDPSNTVLDGNSAGNVLVLSSPEQAVEFDVEGLTLRNGKASESGGGLYANTHGDSYEDGAITLNNNIIIGNSGDPGYSSGGVAAIAFKVTIVNNIISENSGGGINAGYASNSPITITDNTISANTEKSGVHIWGNAVFSNNTIAENSTTGNGGGVWVNGTAIFANNTIMRNSANSVGGGVFVSRYGYDDVTARFTSNTIKDNSAVYDGGGAWVRGNAIFSNNLVTGNSAGGDGGGFNVSDASIINLNCNTITENSSKNGGGAYLSLSNDSDTANIYNNIVYKNSAEKIADDLYIINDGDGDFIPSPVNLYSNDFDQSSLGIYLKIPFTIDQSNLNNADPIFTDAPNSNYHLNLTSPCINVGDNSAPDLSSTDKEGNPRIIGGIVDMGAYERLFAPTVTTNAAKSITATSATLNGLTNPNGTTTTVIFEYGTTTSYGSSATVAQSPIEGAEALSITADLLGLSPRTTYHFRVKATNNEGTSHGNDMNFKTSYTGTLYVNSSGNCGTKEPCYESISEAIQHAEPGSIILVSEGTYSGNFTVLTNTLTIQGKWDNSFENRYGTTTLQGAPKTEQGSLTILDLNVEPNPE